jgi:CheY-like chemotaxis protein
LTVSDTGCGMDSVTMNRIFEPFFTTKEVGKGTGLGLATVLGVVQQHRGWIEVETQPGAGCTFRVYLPALETPVDKGPALLSAGGPLQGGEETILVVEDEEDVRDFVVEVLKGHGYKVLAAGSGPSACQCWAQAKDQIDLLLTDMVMPEGLSGREVAERFLNENPELKVIYTSGYSPGMAGRDLRLMEGSNFLPKPHGPARLLRMVRNCLDGHSEDGLSGEGGPSLGRPEPEADGFISARTVSV